MLLTESLLGSSSTAANYIEDVFSTYLYKGNGSTQTITNGIDLSTKGGLVWIKGRSDGTIHSLTDTVNGAGKFLSSDTTTGLTTNSDNVSGFSATGFTASFSGFGRTNENNQSYVSWTFRKQAKFFDVVTYTGTGAAQTINHNLGSTPGCMIIKCTSTTSAWYVYHRSVDNGSGQAYLALNTTAAADSTLAFTNTPPTSTVFYVGDGVGQNPINQNGATYVAYLFAHNAGGFGASGADNVISCGSWTDSGSGTQTITLGYEPQWLIYKRSDDISNWVVIDNMRGWPVVSAAGSTANLYPNLSNAESGGNYSGNGPTATGFNMPTLGGGTYIYIAIRRGPMKTPTSGTSVFSPVAYTGNGGTQVLTTNFPVDMFWNRTRSAGPGSLMDRLRGQAVLRTEATYSESAIGTYLSTTNVWLNNTGLTFGSGGTDGLNQSGINVGLEAFRRAPGFFDVVCYTGTGSATTVSHNLGVAPELIIAKARQNVSGFGQSWIVWCASLNSSSLNGFLDLSSAFGAYSRITGSSATTFSVGSQGEINSSGITYVAYLFATVAGVSKVGSYTGSGTTKQIDCGFTAGARFVLIKRTDSTGDWYVWDSARGIVAGNDPYLLANTQTAEDTSTDYIDTYSAGFEISSTAPAAINANGGSYIFLAIA